MVCSDTNAAQSIVTMKSDEDKLVPIDSHKLFAISGEAGDRVNFSEFVIANVRLYALRNGIPLSTKAVANFTRGELATALRKVGHPGGVRIPPVCGSCWSTGACCLTRTLCRHHGVHQGLPGAMVHAPGSHGA